MGLFDERIAYKPFEYPEYYTEGWLKQAQAFWLHTEISMLYSFQLRNLLKGIGQQMKWSVRDESLHSKMGCKLFRDMCAEDNQLLHLCREDIINAAETMVKLEVSYIDKMFEMGDIEGISANDLKHFIRKRTNEKLVELGYIDLGSYFAYDKKAADNLNWFYHLTGGVTHTDFFAIRPTDYSKAGEGEDYEDIW